MAEGLQEIDIRAALQNGGRIDGVFVVERSKGRSCSFVLYIRPSGRRGFFIVRTYRDHADREYRDLRILLRYIREQWRYTDPVTIHRAGHPSLKRFKNLAACDIKPAVEVSSLGPSAVEHSTRRASRRTAPDPGAALSAPETLLPADNVGLSS